MRRAVTEVQNCPHQAEVTEANLGHQENSLIELSKNAASGLTKLRLFRHWQRSEAPWPPFVGEADMIPGRRQG